MWKAILAAVAVAPAVALLGGVGVAAYNVSRTWDARNTDALISGLVASCGMGGIVVAGLLAAIIGIPFAMRLMDRWRESEAAYRSPQRDWRSLPPGQALPGWAQQPPQLANGQQGAWQNLGPGTYDVWAEQQPAEPVQADWRG